MIVEKTAAFSHTRNGQDYDPPVMPVRRLMLSALGGWLDSRLSPAVAD
jgi:hypothetical protein